MGFITLGGVFAANMTGNTVLAGIDGAGGRYLDAVRHLSPLVSFFAGAMLARLILRLWQRPMIAIGLEALILACFDFLPLTEEAAVMIIALAMGLQASAITQFGGASISTVVVTSTLARSADAALDALLPAKAPQPRPAATSPRLLALTWLGYLAGAVAGALLLQVMPHPLTVPAALLVVLMVM